MSENIHDLPIVELAGSPQTMGEQFGETCREDIVALYHARMAAARERATTAGAKSTTRTR